MTAATRARLDLQGFWERKEELERRACRASRDLMERKGNLVRLGCLVMLAPPLKAGYHWDSINKSDDNFK